MGMKWSKAISIAESKQEDGQYEKAITYFKKALKIARSNGSKEKEARTLDLLAEHYKSIEKYHEAVDYYNQGLLIAQETGDQELECRKCIDLVCAYNELGQYNDGMKYSKQGLDIALRAGDSEAISYFYSTLGDAYHRLFEYENSMKCYSKAIDMNKQLEDEEGLAVCYENVSITYTNQGKYHDAIHFQEESLRIGDKLGNKLGKAYSLINLGKIHRTSKNTEKAAELCHQSPTIAEEIGDKGLQAVCHEAQLKVSESIKRSKGISVAESKKEDSQYEKAITHFKKALENARSNGSKEEEVRTLNLLAEHYKSMENYHEAVDYYDKGLPIAQETGDQVLECKMCNDLAWAYYQLGQYNDCMKYSKQGLDIALKTGDSKLIALSYRNLGFAYNKLHKYENSMECYNKAIDMYKQLEDEEGLAVCYGNLSISYNQQGKYDDAIHFLEESLRIYDKMGNKLGKAISLLRFGTIHRTLNNTEKAAELYHQSLTIAEEIGDKGIQGGCHVGLGNVLGLSGNHVDAISCYLENLKIAEQVGDKQKLASINMNIGNCYKGINQYQEAHEYYNNSLIIAKEINSKTTESNTYYNLAALHFNSGKVQQAISTLEKSLDIALSIGNRESEGNACYLLGKAYYSLVKDNQEHETRLSSMTKSEEYLKNALVCFDYLFSQLQRRDHLKISIFDSFMNTYKLLTTVYIETQQTQQALLVSDHGRARALGDRLIFKYGISQEEYVSSQALAPTDVENVLSNDAFTLLHYGLLRKSLAVWAIVKDSIIFKQTDKQQFVSAVETLFGEKKKEQENTINRFFTDTVARAYEDMKITEGVKCENRSLDDSVTHKDQHFEGVTQSVSRDGTSVEDPGQKSMHPLVELYNALVAPVLSHVQHDEIVIVPDGKMYTVPFAALIDPNTGQYLSETKRIRLVPSIAILKVLQECPIDHHSQQGALIVGNPSVGEVMFRGKKKTFDNLPSAKMEANCITRLLDNCIALRRNAKITSLTGEQATKDVVLTKLKEGVAIIHIAAHGSADNGEIALAPIASQDRQGIPEEQDYLLTMKEVQQVGIKAQLVVLSCCHSGRGEIRAEGVVGLSRAFLAAGARAVVASLWPINDYVTLSFMVSFYECLCQGQSASVSLDKAIKDIRKGYSDPMYWAPFFLIGDDVTI